METLAFTDLQCVRNGRTLFSGLSRALRPGELLRVQGANGAGKTSLLRMLCGLLVPARGAVTWCGQDIGGLREEFGRKLVYLGHAPALKEELSALENLQVACTVAGRRVGRDEARRALGAAGLRGCEHHPVRRLSQGQRQRGALARLALADGAPLWVLDEPFNALDRSACAWLADLLRAQLQRGGTVLLTSHLDVPLDGTPHQVLAL